MFDLGRSFTAFDAKIIWIQKFPLQWRHNGRDGVSNRSLTIVFSIVYWDANQRKHQSSASLAFVRGSHRGPVNSPHKWPVTRKMFPFHDVIMDSGPFTSVYGLGPFPKRHCCWLLVPCVPKPPAPIVRVLDFNEERFQLHLPSYCGKW